MKVSEAVKLLGGYDDDADVFFRDTDGMLHEISIEFREATFDGFDTAYDEGADIVCID